MYLKTLEMVGFKSFATKTQLEFEPGMTAIVGPNGCGKSNVSDAVRWVLGEQRARALRGAKMEDVIFNGTDSAKPLGMAEVSITLADCSELLGIDYDEVCITRRVFRSGESGYFLNRKACRLKDIHRLFMNTGIGTDSYSVLEQGKIDQILSARPEDRRAVFEEASGITKYKADKKEALRKLEHTETNLLRLDDVIREIKRQINALQRQAGKARRFKALSEEMRDLDIFVTHQRLLEYAQKINELTGELQVTEQRINEQRRRLEAAENEAKSSRNALLQLEKTISGAMEQSSATRSELEQKRHLINVNTDRITELTALAQRNSQETEEARIRLEIHKKERDEIVTTIASAEKEKSSANEALQLATMEQQKVEVQMNTIRTELNTLRTTAVHLDASASKMQNELNSIDARDRETMLKKERLSTEKSELERTLTSYMEHEEAMKAKVELLSDQVTKQTEQLNTLKIERAERKDLIVKNERKLNEAKRTLAAKRAQLEILSGGEARQNGFPPGAQMLLDPQNSFTANRSGMIGPLAEQMTTAPKFQTALEAILRPCIDAIVVRDNASAREILNGLREQNAGSVRLLSVTSTSNDPTPNSSSIGKSLLDCIAFSDEVAPLIRRLFWNVQVVESETEIPIVLPKDSIVVSLNGTIISSCGASELWMPNTKDKSPLARHQLRKQLQQVIEELENVTDSIEQTLKALIKAEADTAASTEQARLILQEHQRELALQQGEKQVIHREINIARNRIGIVSGELNSLTKNERDAVKNRNDLATELQQVQDQQAKTRSKNATQTTSLNAIEERRNLALQITSEHQIVYSHKTSTLDYLNSQKKPINSRITELEALILDRTSEIDAYTFKIKDLQASVENEQNQIDPLETRVEQTTHTLENERARRAETLQILTTAENRLRMIHNELEIDLGTKSKYEVEKTEYTMRHDNALERISGAYRITREELAQADEPKWDDGIIPEREIIETRIAELQTKLSSMGPVNLVAIDEYAEHEERYTFLQQQQSDLTEAKQQLLEMIKTINATTTELFKTTFDQVNANFQGMFKQLFGGGSAKLVLTDSEDVLEAGIEIIARPPGKKLQSISLLSGGERTMTAVALLFSLFKVKPSPFCVLDELDAALDDANIKRFVNSLKEFLSMSQFIIITHSRQTIAAADVIYGVTMQSRGISKVVSMKFTDVQENDYKMA